MIFSGPRWRRSSITEPFTPAPGLDLRRLGARDDVARGELERVRRVALHEPLAVLVDEEATLAAAALRDQDPGRVHRRRVELHELHVLQRQPGAKRHRHPVARAGVGVRRRAEEPAHAPRGEDRRGAEHDLHAAVQQIPADDARAASVVLDEAKGEVLLEDDEPLLHPLRELLEEHLDQDVPGDVGRVDGPRRAGGAERAAGRASPPRSARRRSPTARAGRCRRAPRA